MPYNYNINWVIDRNLTTIKDLVTNSITNMVKKVLIEGKRKIVKKWETWTCTIYFPYRLYNSLQKIYLL